MLNKKQKNVLKEAKEIQKLTLDAWKKINNDFVKEGINWFPHGGTLLGAYRHKGFIPWDDDIDMWMPAHTIKSRFNDINRILEKHDFMLFFGFGEWEWWRMPYFKIFKKTIDKVNGKDHRVFIDIMITIPYDSMSHEEFIKLKSLERKHAKGIVNPINIFNFGVKKRRKKIIELMNTKKSNKYRFFDWKSHYDFAWDISQLRKINFEDEIMLTPLNSYEWFNFFYDGTQDTIPPVPETLKHRTKHIHMKRYVEKLDLNKKRISFNDLLNEK